MTVKPIGRMLDKARAAVDALARLQILAEATRVAQGASAPGPAS